MKQRPKTLNGLRHLALLVPNLEACERFYVDLLGMQVLRRAHEDLVYLTLGNDNLSLGRMRDDAVPSGTQMMDHFGFIVDSAEELDAWHDYLLEQGVTIKSAPHDHSDGARSFYCLDPAGNAVQPLYHPAVSGQQFSTPA
jgi:catechol 2,3-dioxygenase-like lactoylglutathione lyase family enzyme